MFSLHTSMSIDMFERKKKLTCSWIIMWKKKTWPPNQLWPWFRIYVISYRRKMVKIRVNIQIFSVSFYNLNNLCWYLVTNSLLWQKFVFKYQSVAERESVIFTFTFFNIFWQKSPKTIWEEEVYVDKLFQGFYKFIIWHGFSVRLRLYFLTPMTPHSGSRSGQGPWYVHVQCELGVHYVSVVCC